MVSLQSLQAVYQYVRRLMTLAYPGQSGSLWDIMARDAFVDALNNSRLRLKILEKDPVTLEEALKIATRFEALSLSPDGEVVWYDCGRRRERYVKGAVYHVCIR